MLRKRIYSTFVLLWFCGVASAADEAFLKDAADGNTYEIRLGQLAQINGSSPLVKDFGQRMVTDHGILNEKVEALAAKENIKLPTDISAEEKLSYTILSKKTGADFDKAYLAVMAKDHEGALAAFEREVDSGADTAAKDLAAKAIPVIKEHLRLAQQISSQLGPSGQD